jgi:hypothetical protein
MSDLLDPFNSAAGGTVGGIGTDQRSIDDLNALGQGDGIERLVNPREIRDSANPGLNQSKYDFSFRTFPEDVGSEYSEHYMVININVPVKSDGTTRSNYDNVVGEGGTFQTTILRNDYSKVDNLRFNRDAGLIQGALNNDQNRELYTPKRGTRRAVESIALFMPSPIIYTGTNSFEEISLSAIAGKIASLAARPAAALLGSGVGAAASRSVRGGQRGGAAGGNLVDSVARNAGTTAALAGNPINPRIEVIFSNTFQRQFNFEFLMAPRSPKESMAIREIIKTLRYHSAPEIATLGVFIPTFIPPAEFDISFYRGNEENMSIPRINTCVLERIDVDYTPTGIWSTFENGYPVATRLSLAFREIEIVHKRRIVQGF